MWLNINVTWYIVSGQTNVGVIKLQKYTFVDCHLAMCLKILWLGGLDLPHHK